MATKAATKEAGPDDIMAAGAMKPILATAKHGNPVHCAMALTKDKEGILLLDKKLKPKSLMVQLKKQAEEVGLELDMGSLRFGKAVISEQDTALVTLAVNKNPPSALRPKMLERLKKAGYSKLDLIIDSALEEEPEEGAADPKQAAELDQIKKKFAELIAGKKTLIGENPPLLKLVKYTSDAIAKGDAKHAHDAVDSLASQLSKAEKVDGAPGAEWAKKQTDYGKAAQIWAATVSKLDKDFKAIRADIVKAFQGHEDGPAIEKEFMGQAEACMKNLDLALNRELDGLSKVNGGPQTAALVNKASKKVDEHISYVENNPLLDKIDTNPLKIKVRETLTASLEKIKDVLSA